MITSIDIYELAIEQISIYRDREISEKQIESVQVKDAGNALIYSRLSWIFYEIYSIHWHAICMTKFY